MPGGLHPQALITAKRFCQVTHQAVVQVAIKN